MTAATIPVVSLARHAAPSTWTKAQRAELAKRLFAVGLTITECSDARERLGFPRLSEASDWDRANCHLHSGSPEFKAVLAEIRAERQALLVELDRAGRKSAVTTARRLLGLRSGWDLRLAELGALLDQTRVVELTTETPREVWAAVTRPLHAHKWTEAELFAGSEAL